MAGEASLLEILAWGDQGWSRPLLVGLGVTVACASLGYVLGVGLGFALALAKLGRNRWVAAAANAYTTVVRGVPPLLVIFLLFFGTNGALMWIAGGFGYNGYIEVDAFTVGVMAVTLVSASYSSEVFRGAHATIPGGQFEAFAALGLRSLAGLCLVIMPQMFRYALPGLGNVWIMAIKETTLLSVISLAELMRVVGLAGRTTGQPFFFYGVAAVVYLVLVAASSRAFVAAERRMRWG
ncbi:ABC transporter permease [Nitratireductor pacificus]|uniref:Histidine/lysine/arginine/ornithine ABC transporter, permease component n=1 Tax=Nitratireductor pacificus pht-3B TaxID=391937 RepID=K2MAJ6_9HYPH|nr:ABC transporter permease subunit [Nitratireductor pacificus]EKF19156.1 histidine/lysine/arginine/ornithine ABC transporter, permease component [Nitratireductor pacificus pht-3B]